MYIESVPNRNSPPCVLLRESYRQEGKVRKRTLANLTSWPEHLVEGLRCLLKGGTAVPELGESLRIVRSRPHGHVAAVWGTLRSIGLLELLDRAPSRLRSLAAALIAARVLEPRSKLATARGLDEDGGSSTLAQEAGIGTAEADELYAALDWLLERQQRIEAKLAERHLEEGSLVLYDLTSCWFEGRTCELAQPGYSRDGKKGKPQIVIGLLCSRSGCPTAVQVFEGSTADPATLSSQIAKLRERFGLRQVVLVGDRGLITSRRIREDLAPQQGLGWITALRAPQIRRLADQGHLQLSLFDQRELAEIESPDFPGERLIVCRNPLLAHRRARKRQELIEATQGELERIAQAVSRPKRPLRGKDKIGLRAGKVLNRFKMGKHFELNIGEDCFSFRLLEHSVEREVELDGLYALRTNLPAKELDSQEAVGHYKGLSEVERAFRSLKTAELRIRPIHHRLADRVRAHVFLCMLAYYLQWHMRRRLAPLLFDDHDKETARRRRSCCVAPAKRSRKGQLKAARKRTEDGLPAHSFRTLLADLATIVRNTVQPDLPGARTFEKTTLPSPLQQRVFELLKVRL